MSTETTTRTVYPPQITDLLPKARTLASELGELPSRNRLMTELRIGAPKARAILAALTEAKQASEYREALNTYHLQRGGLATLPPTDQEPTATALTTVPAGTHLHAVPDQPDPADDQPAPAAVDVPQVAPVVDPGTPQTTTARRPVRSWPVWVLAAPAFIAIWSGWVGLGGLTGFGIVHPLPGIADGFSINTAITLPIGVETYAAFALHAWLSGHVPAPARRFAKWSAIGSLILGALGQVAYHLMSAAGMTTAPWWITTAVACLPVAVLGMGAALAHLLRADNHR